MEIKKLLEEGNEGDILFVDEFMDKHKIVRGYGKAYLIHQVIVDYREWLLKNRKGRERKR